MNRSPTDAPAPRPRRRLVLWTAVGAAAASIGLTVWALSSRADAPTVAAPAAHSDLHYNFLGYADLEQGVTPLYPATPGRVVKVTAHDGDAVDEGAPLFAVDDERATQVVAMAEAALRDAQLLLDQANKLPGQHQAQIDAQTQAVEVRKQEAAAAHAQADEAKRLNKLETKPVSDEKAHAAEATALAADAAAKAEEAKLHALEQDDPSFGVKRAQTEVDVKQGQLKEAQLGLRECTVRAPAKGVVERMMVSVGQALGPNPTQPAAMFAADGPRIVRAEVEQEWANHVGVGMSATIQDYSAVGMTWRGKVAKLSDWYTHRRSILMEPLQFNDVRTLEAIITLDSDQQPPPRIGQRVRVTLENGK